MKKVLTYGTFDLLHEGHVNILRRAKALGDYLIVGVTSDAYDRYRGKLNVRQSVTERIAAVRDTGFADQIIIEEYEGQKIEDIKKYDVDIITLGSDWAGKIDYLKKYCEVVYLPRTPNISSTLLRTGGTIFRIGVMCDYCFGEEALDELQFVSGCDVNAFYSSDRKVADLCNKRSIELFSSSKEEFANCCDIIFVDSNEPNCDDSIRIFLEKGKHVLTAHSCSLSSDKLKTLHELAIGKGVCFLSTTPLAGLVSYTKLINIALSGAIGALRGVDLSIFEQRAPCEIEGFIRRLAPTCLLPVTQLFGWDIKRHSCHFCNGNDSASLIVCDFETSEGYAHLKISRDAPTDCRCIIQGDDGYIMIPAPWWNMDYFEIRSRSGKIKKFSWSMNGNAIRYQLADFTKFVREKKSVEHQMEAFLRILQLTENIFIY